MTSWLNIFKHLLPNSRAWRITVDNKLRQFFRGLSSIGEDSKEFFDGVYDDLDPQKTRDLDSWEKQFALPGTSLTEQQRRDRLEATWKTLGGQDPRYIQDRLQASGFDVYVHEWWGSIPGRPDGGSINGDVRPVARNPFNYLDDGTNKTLPFLMREGTGAAQDGSGAAQDGSINTFSGYPLVNKILESLDEFIGDGGQDMQDGGQASQDGRKVTIYRRKQYKIPEDPTKYPFFLYIGGQTFPDQATVPKARKDEFEDLCLKICPTEQWLGVLVNYS